MKYVVAVNGRDLEVEVVTDGVLVGGRPFVASLVSVSQSPVQVLRVGDAVHQVQVHRGAQRGQFTLRLDGYRFDVEAIDERSRTIRQLAAATVGPQRSAPLAAPMPGMIVRIHVEEGDAVEPGQGLVVMEAMKMENELRASVAGTVKRVLVAPGTAVEKGALLLELE